MTKTEILRTTAGDLGGLLRRLASAGCRDRRFSRVVRSIREARDELEELVDAENRLNSRRGHP